MSGESVPCLTVNLPDTERLDATALYQQGIQLALSHAGGNFDLKRNAQLTAHVTNLPNDTVLASVLPIFLSQAFDEIASCLTDETADPAYAFFRQQLASKGEVDFVRDEGGFASAQITAEDAETLTSWTLCFDQCVAH